MALLDDLKGILSPEEFSKIQGSPVATRLTRGSELLSYYDGDAVETPAATTSATVTPSAATTPAGMFDLSEIDRRLEARLGKLNELVDTRVNDIVATRGNELVNNAVKISLQRADELNRIYSRHVNETGKQFDSADFNNFLEKPEVKARGYRTITQAYDDYVAPQTQERVVEQKVQERLRAQSGSNVPGSTPAPSSSSALKVFMKRGTAAEGGGTTGASRAAAMLDRMGSSRQEMAS